LYKLVKDSVDYRALPTKVSKQIIRKLLKNWRSYFKALKAWKETPNLFLGKPSIPGYKDKINGRNMLIYTHEAVYKKTLAQGMCHLSMSGIKVPTLQAKVIEVRIIPQTSCYVLEIVYEQAVLKPKCTEYVAGVDLGLNNLVALASNQPGIKPLLINGRPLKAVNQFLNKCRSKLQSLLPKNQFKSKRLDSITFKRNQYVENYLHQTSKLIVDWLNEHQIGTLVIGKNPNWKQKINLCKRNNQQFVQIPHAKLIEKITSSVSISWIKSSNY